MEYKTIGDVYRALADPAGANYSDACEFIHRQANLEISINRGHEVWVIRGYQPPGENLQAIIWEEIRIADKTIGPRRPYVLLGPGELSGYIDAWLKAILKEE